jgi:hypothetical protein
MTGRKWLEEQMDKAWRERSAADRTADMAEARFYAFKYVLENLPVEQMEIQTAAGGAAKE